MRFFERRSPNELWHTDVMYFIMPNHEKVFVIGYLDDYSRYVVSLDLFHRQTVGNTIDLLKKGVRRLHVPERNPDRQRPAVRQLDREQLVRDLSAQPPDQTCGLPHPLSADQCKNRTVLVNAAAGVFRQGEDQQLR